MPFSPQTLEEKPYNACLNCVYIGKKCDGPNFLAMSVERWCEWCKLRKKYLGWTSDYVAERANVSKVSVDRVMRGDVKDMRISTMQAVTKALVNGTWGQYPCVMAATGMDESEAATKQCARLYEEIDKIKADHKTEFEALRVDYERTISFLKDQVKFRDEQILAKDKLLESITHLIDGYKK